MTIKLLSDSNNTLLKQTLKIMFTLFVMFSLFFLEINHVKAEETVSKDYTAESIMHWVLETNLPDGDYNVTVNGTLSNGTAQTVTYPVELINYYGDVTYTESVALGDNTTNKRMLVVKYYGDLTINEGVVVTANTNSTAVSGYGTYALSYKKGMYIHVMGSLTNNGTISMTARGTYNQVGENVFIFKNSDGTFEYVPAVGAVGGANVVYTHGRVGGAGTARETGGGGSGASLRGATRSGAGATGTSYSGGSGGGGASSAADSGVTASAGSGNGGPGGRATGRRTSSTMYVASGGAGNPGGRDARPTAGANKTVYGNYTSSANVGTGGLLILYAGYIENNGSIISNGSSSRPPAGYNTGVAASGGSSGGGSVNIFTSNAEIGGTVNAAGGVSVACAYKGGNGGAGYSGVTQLIFDEEYVTPTLSRLEIDGQTYTPEFNKNTYEYFVTLKADDYRVNIDAYLTNEDNTITSGIGTFDIPIGDSTHQIVVTSKLGIINIYTIHFYRYESSYKYLNSIKIDGRDLPNFSPTTLNYSVNINPENETVLVEADYGRTSQTISGIGDIAVSYGDTKHNIDVISEDGKNITTYTVTFHKANSSKLKSLTIEDYILDPTFDADSLEYVITIPNWILSLNVDAVAFDSSAKVTVKGNGYLKNGAGNIITITVSQGNVGTTTYKINVLREGVVTQTEYKYSCTKTYKIFEAPGSGEYKIELWGAQGGYGKQNRVNKRGAYGGYTSGTIWLNKGETFYVYVGCVGGNGTGVTGGAGGYNGGGTGGHDKNHDDYPDPAGGGGGATDIRLVNGAWNNFESLKSRIMIAGGGAGGNYGTNGTAGGLYLNKANSYALGQGAAGGTYNSGSGGGGGGYFGGRTTYSDGGLGYGGTSFVSGATNGTLALTEESTSTALTFKEDSIHYSGYAFENVQMISGNASMPSKTTGYVTGSAGHGYARITLLPTPSENNFLSSLSVKTEETERDITYTPSFALDTLDYYANVDVNETKVTISGRLEDSTATPSGFGTYDIIAGTTIIPIAVTAENGDVRTYNIHVNRQASTDKHPSSIIISGLVPSLCSINENYCKLNPSVFNQDTHTYEITVPSRIKQLQFDVEKKHPYQTAIGEGKVTLNGGENIITIEVTNEAATESTVYTYHVIRDMTGNTDLSELSILDPIKEINFDPDITEYYLSVPNEYTSIKELVVVTDDPNAGHIIIGNENFTVGMNQINILVTASNGETKVYSLMVYREKSGNTYLSTLTIADQTTEYPLTPEFNKVLTGIYKTTVPNNITEVTVSATKEASTSSVTGTGVKTLKTGNNTVNIIVTAEDGSVETYQIIVTRQKNNNNYLSNLETNKGTLTPSFNREILEYTLDVPAGTTEVLITPTVELATAKYQLLDNNSIKLGTNIKRILVMAEDGTTRTYQITINRPASDNNNLSMINLTSSNLEPAFDTNVTEYTVTVDNSVKTINVTATKEDPLALLKGTGTYNIATGENEILLTVTSESGIDKNYLITIHRAYNNDATLKTITTSEGVIVPTFNPSTNTYIVNVENNIDNITITGTPNVSTTSVSGNGAYPLRSGSNVITLTTLAEDNTTSITYTIDVVKDTSDNDNLGYLLIEEGAISPAFSANIINYEVDVPKNTTELNFHVETEDDQATYQIIGNSNLTEGENTVIVRVISETGQTTGDYKDYTINVIVQSLSPSNYLTNLGLSTSNLDKPFNKNTSYYEVEVPYNITSITVSGTKEDPNATVTGFGTHNLSVGKNLIVIKVTDTNNQDRFYQIVVTRKQNNEARLSTIIVENSMLSPSFSQDTYEYTLESYLEELNFTSIKTLDPNATYQIIYGTKTDRSSNYLVTIRVTAADKVTTHDYLLNVTKNPNNNNNLSSLSIEGYTITPVFNKTTTLYYLTVENNVNTIVINATSDDPYATIDGAGSQTLEVGENNLLVEVTSESGIKKTYAIIVTKEGSDNNYLSDINVVNYTLSPDFNKENLNYTINVPYDTTYLNITTTKEEETSTVRITGQDNLEVGTNIINITVTSESGNIRTYVITVTRNQIISSLIKDLNVTDYQISPSFNSNLKNYDITVDNEITSITSLINVELVDQSATYQITNGDNLEIGTNEVYITVTSSDLLQTTTYTLEVDRQMYSNTYLDYLYTSSGDLEPLFNKNTLTYNIDVPNYVTSIEIFGEAVDKSATVTGLGIHQLTTGANKITISVTTSSGITRKYYVTVTRSKATDNYLENLSAKTGTTKLELTPEFISTTNEYQIEVSPGTREITLTGTVPETAKVTGLGTREITVGNNTINIVVTSENGDINTYVITVTRPASNNNYLTELIPSAGELEPDFSYYETTYTLNLDSSAALLSFEYGIEDQNATITGTNAIPVPDGTSSRTITVTAEDGTTREYTINIRKERTDNAALESLSVTGYTFTEAFNTGTYEYTITVPNSKMALLSSEVNAIASDSNAKITKSSNLSLSTSTTNQYVIKVTAPDGFTTQEYTINVIREKSNLAQMTSLSVKHGYLTTTFNPNTDEYNWKITDNATVLTTTDIIATTSNNGVITTTENLELSRTTDNIYEITVTSENGEVTKKYTLHVSYDLSNQTTIESLTVDKGYYLPTFNKEIREYNVYVYEDETNVTLKATPSETVEITGGTGRINLTDIITTTTINTIAEDGTIGLYTININKTISKETNVNNIELVGINESSCLSNNCLLSPTFNEDVYEYKIKVPNDYINLDILVTAKNDQQTFKYYANSTPIQNGSYRLPSGRTSIEIAVYDGMNNLTNTYTLELERLKSNNTNLKSLSVTNYELSPSFNKETLEYTINVPNDIDEVIINASAEDSGALVQKNGYNYLVSGDNVATVTVIAPNGDFKEYYLHIIKEPLYNNYIKNITMSIGTFLDLSPMFSPTTFNYTTVIPANATKITLEAVPVVPTTEISGTGEYQITTGSNKFVLVSTAIDGSISTYVINARKETSRNVNLKFLTTEEGNLSPTFEKGTAKYTMNVGEDVSKLTLTAIPEDTQSKIIVTGNNNFHAGLNVVNIIVNSSDKSASKTYQISVTKDESTNALLQSLTVSNEDTNYQLTPKFDKHNNKYTLEVENEVTSVLIEAVAESPYSSITGIGTEALTTGYNQKMITVISENGTINLYQIDIHRKYNLNLKDIISDEGELSPAFDPNITEYSLSVPNNLAEITILAQKEDPDVTVTGSGTYEISISGTPITFTVKDPDNNLKTYTVNAIKEKDSNNNIKNLVVHEGRLDKTFDKNITTYTTNIKNNLTKIGLDIILESNKATYEVVGNNFTNNTNLVKIIVTAENGNKKTYELTVIRQDEAYFSNRLLNITLSNGTLSPDFDPDINYYAVTVSNSTKEITINATKENVDATAIGLGTKSLSLGRNIFQIEVTSKDEISNTYTLIIYREEGTDTKLKSLSVENHNLNPVFNKFEHNYMVEVDGETNYVNINAIPSDENAKVTITGANYLEEGTNEVKITVTSPDGKTNEVYTIEVVKITSTNNYLTSLTVSGYELVPIFSSNNQGPYRITVDNDVNSVLITAIPEAETTSITGAGAQTLVPGINTINVQATSASGDIRTYTIIITKQKNTNSKLKSLTLNEGNLIPEFNPDTLEYQLSLSEEVESITVNALAEASTSTISGTGTIDLKTTNKINVVVTSEAKTQTTYQININRVLEESSKIKELIVKNGKLTPEFHKNTTEYFVSIPNEITSLDMLITLESANSTYEITNNNNFQVGSNEVTITVTSSTGTKTEYIIVAIREPIASNYLKDLNITNQTLNPVFNKSTLYYEVDVSNELESIEINASVEDPTSILTGTGIKEINPGKNTFYITVTSSTGVNRTYTVVVNRTQDANGELLSLSTNVGELFPAFEPTIKNYTVEVPIKTTSITVSATTNEFTTLTGPGDYSIQVGQKEIKVITTSQNGAINVYTITVTRPPSTNTNITKITPLVGTINYQNSISEYNITVDDNTTTMSFNVETEDKDATVTGNELSVLSYGLNHFKITVTAEDNLTTNEVFITVERIIQLNKIIPSENNIVLSVNQSKQIDLTFEPSDAANQNVEWTSLNEEIASVNNGLITGIKNGYATIQVKSTEDASIYTNITVNVLNLKITTTEYEIYREEDLDYLIGLEPLTKLSDFITKFDNNQSTLYIYDKNGNEITDPDQYIGNTMVIKLIIQDTLYDELIIIVRGDLDGDGMVTVADQTLSKNVVLKKIEKTRIYEKTSDVDRDINITVADLTKIKNFVLKKIPSLNR